jgi:hypothetical protein
VKTLRLYILLLLAVLLPVRGAVAAAMMCPPSGSGSPHAMHGSGEHAGHHHEHAPSGAHDHAAGDKCGLCAACCTAAPLVGNAPGVSVPNDLRTAGFPALLAQAPSFVSDGPERPPRSC